MNETAETEATTNDTSEIETIQAELKALREQVRLLKDELTLWRRPSPEVTINGDLTVTGKLTVEGEANFYQKAYVHRALHAYERLHTPHIDQSTTNLVLTAEQLVFMAEDNDSFMYMKKLGEWRTFDTSVAPKPPDGFS